MPQDNCAWREGCAEAAVEKSSLCEDHKQEAIRLRKLKVEGWAMKKQARDNEHLAIVAILTSATMDALFTVAQTIEDAAGEITVSSVSQRGAFTNFLLGSNKGYLPQEGWYASGGMAQKDLVGGLSLEAARLFADEYNTRLSDMGVEGVTAVPRI
jgi:hypothetical protein